jgi:hypothetical protein
MMFWLSNRLLKQLSVLTRPPRRAKTRLSAGKAAANYRLIRGGWNDPNCARPPSAASSCGVREHRDRPSYPAPYFSSSQVVAW